MKISKRALRFLAIALGLLNLALCFGVVWLRNGFDALTGRINFPHRPPAMFGAQELLVYFDPWLACWVFPFIYTFGFVAVSYLFEPSKNPKGEDYGSSLVMFILVGLEMVWVFLFVLAILCRGPNWNFYWPWEPWDGRLVPLNTANYSIIFWYIAGQRDPISSCLAREAPGIILAVGYFSLGLLVSSSLCSGKRPFTASGFFLLYMFFAMAPLFTKLLVYGDVNYFNINLSLLLTISCLIAVAGYVLYRLLSGWDRSLLPNRPMSYWRCALLVLLLQVAALVPAKMLLYWLFNMKYFIYLPEYSVNM